MLMPNSIWCAGGVRQKPIEYTRSLIWLGAILLNHALHCQPARAQDSTPAQKSDKPADSMPADGSVSIEDLARRMQTLERQNAELADHNRSLTHQLDKVTRRFDELNKRLERIEP